MCSEQAQKKSAYLEQCKHKCNRSANSLQKLFQKKGILLENPQFIMDFTGCVSKIQDMQTLETLMRVCTVRNVRTHEGKDGWIHACICICKDHGTM